MIIKAIKNNLKIKEISVDYYKRKGNSKLKPFSDGWKHLRFMLLYSPLFLFFIPGLLLFIAGILLIIYSPFFSCLFSITGFQLIIFSGFAKAYALNHLNEKSENFEKLFKYITIERAVALGFFVLLTGILVGNSTFSLTLLIIGIQTIFSSFMLSILGIKK
jgi:hypothetical protein